MEIPKRIHYCWFGGRPLPPLAVRCLDSWRRHCPDYQLVRWDESNSPLADNDYVRQAYAAKKWAFVSDYVRLYALCREGGIYLDTDVELLRPLDGLLRDEGCLGFEARDRVATCLMGCVPGHPLFLHMKEDYAGRQFARADGSFDTTTNVARLTALLTARGLVCDNQKQRVADLTVYPCEYFSPKSLETGKLLRTERSVAIHHFQASWMPLKNRVNTKLAQLLGPELTRRLKGLRKGR